jgi:hypothetical protein
VFPLHYIHHVCHNDTINGIVVPLQSCYIYCLAPHEGNAPPLTGLESVVILLDQCDLVYYFVQQEGNAPPQHKAAGLQPVYLS